MEDPLYDTKMDRLKLSYPRPQKNGVKILAAGVAFGRVRDGIGKIYSYSV